LWKFPKEIFVSIIPKGKLLNDARRGTKLNSLRIFQGEISKRAQSKGRGHYGKFQREFFASIVPKGKLLGDAERCPKSGGPIQRERAAQMPRGVQNQTA
jgi:hypothetical protein